MNAITVRSAAALLAAVAVAGCSSLPFGGGADEPALIAQSQPKRAGNNVIISSVTLTEPGYVVVHADSNGRPGAAVIGRTDLIDAGTHTNVNVQIDGTRAGSRVHPMLHVDDGDGVYEFPGSDGPVTIAGSPLVVPVDWL